MITQLVFSVTHDCPVTCKYCVTESGPHGGPYLEYKFMKRAFEEILQLGQLRSVVFTGGEALIKASEVEETIKYISSFGLWTRIVTNAYWAFTRKDADNMLLKLKSAGISEINISCDDLHQENIPLENVYNAFWAARELKIPTLIAHKYVKGGKITVDYLSEYLGVKLKIFREGKQNPDYDIISSSYTVPIGYGSKWLNEDEYIIYPKHSGVWQSPCRSVLSSVIVSPNKELRLCCGMIDQKVLELNFGNWDEKPLLQMIYEANCDLIANWIALEGPYGLMKFIKEKAPEINFRENYVNHCHLCDDILTRQETRDVLLNYGSEKVDEISLRRGLLEGVRYSNHA